MRRTLALRVFSLSTIAFVIVVVLFAVAMTKFGFAPEIGFLKKHVNLWILDDKGTAIAQLNDTAVPPEWREALPTDPENALSFRPGVTPFNRRLVAKLRGGNHDYAVVMEINGPILLPSIFPTRFPFGIVLLFFIALGSAGVLCGVVFLWLRRTSREADQVLARIRGGDLKARFPLRPLDEAGQLMAKFNEMADDIEGLVGRLRQSESFRSQLIRELSHDLRTPLTSLRYLNDRLMAQSSKISPRELKKKLYVMGSEFEYFERLISDLFLLAQVNDPEHRPELEPLDFLALLRDEAMKLANTTIDDEAAPSWNFGITDGQTFQTKGEPHLMRRMLRNLLDNAAEHAETNVWVTASCAKGGREITLEIRDDGPGFPEAVLGEFGKRRTTRYLEFGKGRRVSLGLGSVIASKVAALFGGALTVENWRTKDGATAGARVQLRLTGIAGEKPSRKAA